jgi:hypothetical protein
MCELSLERLTWTIQAKKVQHKQGTSDFLSVLCASLLLSSILAFSYPKPVYPISKNPKRVQSY